MPCPRPLQPKKTMSALKGAAAAAEATSYAEGAARAKVQRRLRSLPTRRDSGLQQREDVLRVTDPRGSIVGTARRTGASAFAAAPRWVGDGGGFELCWEPASCSLVRSLCGSVWRISDGGRTVLESKDAGRTWFRVHEVPRRVVWVGGSGGAGEAIVHVPGCAVVRGAVRATLRGCGGGGAGDNDNDNDGDGDGGQVCPHELLLRDRVLRCAELPSAPSLLCELHLPADETDAAAAPCGIRCLSVETPYEDFDVVLSGGAGASVVVTRPAGRAEGLLLRAAAPLSASSSACASAPSAAALLSSRPLSLPLQASAAAAAATPAAALSCASTPPRRVCSTPDPSARAEVASSGSGDAGRLAAAAATEDASSPVYIHAPSVAWATGWYTLHEGARGRVLQLDTQGATVGRWRYRAVLGGSADGGLPRGSSACVVAALRSPPVLGGFLSEPVASSDEPPDAAAWHAAGGVASAAGAAGAAEGGVRGRGSAEEAAAAAEVTPFALRREATTRPTGMLRPQQLALLSVCLEERCRRQAAAAAVGGDEKEAVQGEEEVEEVEEGGDYAGLLQDEVSRLVALSEQPQPQQPTRKTVAGAAGLPVCVRLFAAGGVPPPAGRATDGGVKEEEESAAEAYLRHRVVERHVARMDLGRLLATECQAALPSTVFCEMERDLQRAVTSCLCGDGTRAVGGGGRGGGDRRGRRLPTLRSVATFCALWAGLVRHGGGGNNSGDDVVLIIPRADVTGVLLAADGSAAKGATFGFHNARWGVSVGRARSAQDAADACLERVGDSSFCNADECMLVVRHAAHFVPFGDAGFGLAAPFVVYSVVDACAVASSGGGGGSLVVVSAREVGLTRRRDDPFLAACAERHACSGGGGSGSGSVGTPLLDARAGAARAAVVRAMRGYDAACRGLHTHATLHRADPRRRGGGGGARAASLSLRDLTAAHDAASRALRAAYGAWTDLGGGDVLWQSLSAAQLSGHQQPSRQGELARRRTATTATLAAEALETLRSHVQFAGRRCYHREALARNARLNAPELRLRHARSLLALWRAVALRLPPLRRWAARARAAAAAAAARRDAAASAALALVRTALARRRTARAAAAALQRAGRGGAARRVLGREAPLLAAGARAALCLRFRAFRAWYRLRLGRRAARAGLVQACLRARAAARLAAARAARVAAAVVLQRAHRRRLRRAALRRRLALRSAVRAVQRLRRRQVAERRLRAAAATVVQGAWQGGRVRRRLAREAAAVGVLQRVVRGVGGRRTAASAGAGRRRQAEAAAAEAAAVGQERGWAASLVGGVWRRVRLQRRFRAAAEEAVCVDRARRAAVVRGAALGALAVWGVRRRAARVCAATWVQAAARAAAATVLVRRVAAARTLQRRWRAAVAAAAARAAAGERRRRRAAERASAVRAEAAVRVQTAWRMWARRAAYERRRVRYRRLQEGVRRFLREVEAAVVIQCFWRRFHVAPARVARVVRARSARRHRAAAAVALAYQKMLRRRRLAASAKRIQTFFRCYRDLRGNGGRRGGGTTVAGTGGGGLQG